MKNLAIAMVAFFLCALFAPGLASAADAGVKQPIFLLCPHKERLSAWSLYFLVDANDPSKVLSMGLEELTKQNSKDSSYEAVVTAASDAKTTRREIGSLAAAEFGKGQIHVEKDDALKTNVTPLGDGEYRLMVSLRIAADLRFNIGGKETEKRDVVVSFDKASKKWKSTVKTLKDAEGNAIDDAKGKEVTGIAFKVTGTGIYEIVAAVSGMDSIKVLDR